MKTTIRTIALATLVAVASLSQTVIAQTGVPATTVDIPFAFDSGTQHFAAGVYLLSIERQNLLHLRNGNLHASVFESKAERRAAHDFAANHLSPTPPSVALP